LPGLGGQAGVARGLGKLSRGYGLSQVLLVLRIGGPALAGDQTVEPCDLALALVQPVVHQLDGVGVHALAGGAHRGAQVGQPLLEVAPPPFELVEAGLGPQVAEEGQPHGEPVLLQVVALGRLQEAVEQAVAVIGEPVDVLLARGEGGDLDLEGALGGPPLQARLQGAVAHPPEGPELERELLLQLIARHRCLLEQPQYGQLEHGTRPLLLVVHYCRPSRCIDSMYHDDRYARAGVSTCVAKSCPPVVTTASGYTGAEMRLVDYTLAKRAKLTEL